MKSSYFSRLLPVLAALAGQTMVDAKAVFAHFMVGNVGDYKDSDWADDIKLAQQSGIDAFALNIAAGDGATPAAIEMGFKAAEAAKFGMFFSFDYLATGAWPAAKVVELVNKYKVSASYYKQDGKPLVSTFEGVDNSGDWAGIKSQTDCFFVPDWSSMEASKAAGVAGVDGLFNWGAWPDGASDMTTAADEKYVSALGGKPYMMAVSPWFYTNLPGWSKNWVWRGDDLWFDRWQQVLALQPDLVEIITWNDYGESHYVGPVRETGFGLFQSGKAPINYVKDMPHDGWRKFLPWLIKQYKGGAGGGGGSAGGNSTKPAPSGSGSAAQSTTTTAAAAKMNRFAPRQVSAAAGPVSAEEEGLTIWYKLTPGEKLAAGCDAGGTTGNDAGHGQTVTEAAKVLEDRVFFSALLGSEATVSVTIGGQAVADAKWESAPGGGSGMYHGSVPFGGRTGDVVVSVARGGKAVAEVKGKPIASSCPEGFVNWNAWVGASE